MNVSVRLSTSRIVTTSPFLTMSGTLCMGMFAEHLPARDTSVTLAYSDNLLQHRPASLLPIPMPWPKQHGITSPFKPVDVRWEVEPMVGGVPVRIDSRLLRGDGRANGYLAGYRRGGAHGPSPHDIQHVQGKEGKHISPTREASNSMKRMTSTTAC